jgi:hypothetical protein
MIYNLPLRLTTLHFAQRLRMEGPTFIIASPCSSLCNQRFDYTCSIYFRPASGVHADRLWDSQDERVTFGDGNGMLIMRR